MLRDSRGRLPPASRLPGHRFPGRTRMHGGPQSSSRLVASARRLRSVPGRRAGSFGCVWFIVAALRLFMTCLRSASRVLRAVSRPAPSPQETRHFDGGFDPGSRDGPAAHGSSNESTFVRMTRGFSPRPEPAARATRARRRRAATRRRTASATSAQRRPGACATPSARPAAAPASRAGRAPSRSPSPSPAARTYTGHCSPRAAEPMPPRRCRPPAAQPFSSTTRSAAPPSGASNAPRRPVGTARRARRPRHPPAVAAPAVSAARARASRQADQSVPCRAASPRSTRR